MSELKKAFLHTREPGLSEGDMRRASSLFGQWLDEQQVCRELGLPHFSAYIHALLFNACRGVQFIVDASIDDIPLRTIVNSLEGYEVLIRSDLRVVEPIIKHIEEMGGKPALTLEDELKVINWPNYVLPDFTGRKIGIIKASDLLAEAGKYMLNGQVFIKPAKKDTSSHGTLATEEEIANSSEQGIPIIDTRFKSNRAYQKVGPNRDLMISEPVGFLANSANEYRVWVINHNAVAITNYQLPDNKPISEQARKFSNDFVLAHRERLPRHYVLDVGFSKEKPLVVELNPITSAGGSTKEAFRDIAKAFI